MPPFGFVGPDSAGQVSSASAQRTINWYLERTENPGAKSQLQLVGTPGSKIWLTLPNSGLRGIFSTNPGTSAERCFVVADGQFWEFSAAGALSNNAQIANDGLPVGWAFNGLQVLLRSAGFLYVFTLATNMLSAALGDPVGVSAIGFCKTFGLALVGGTRNMRFSGVNDFTSWNGLDLITVTDFADNLVSMGVDHNQIMLRGAKRSEIYYADGSSSVFVPVPGSGLVEVGTGAQYGGVTIDGTQYWWGQSEDSGPIAYRLEGYRYVRISDEPRETSVRGFPAWTDVECYAIEHDGHLWWVSRFPSANNGKGFTWVYDIKMQNWFQLAWFNQQTGEQVGHRSRCHAYAFGKHLIGDPLSANIYQIDVPKLNASGTWDFCDDFGGPLVSDRIAAHAGSGKPRSWDFWSLLEFIMDTGQGPPAGIPGLEGLTVITMQSPNGTKYDLTMTEGSALQGNPSILNGAAQTIKLRDNGNPSTTAWQVNMLNGGILQQPVQIAYDATLPQLIRFVTQLGDKAVEMTVTSAGILQNIDLGNLTRSPQVQVRFCRDGMGKTWGNWFTMNFGKAGEYVRVFRNNLGKTRGTNGLIVWSRISDAVPRRITEALLE